MTVAGQLHAALRAEAVPLLLAAAFVAAAAVLALGWHPIEIADAENDGYAQQAEQLLAGAIPRDVWHPLHYPLLVAAATPLVGDAFVAGKLVSVLGGGLLVFAASALARRLGGRTAACWTAAILGVQGGLLVYGVQAAADVPALGGAAVALLLAARAAGAAGRSGAALAAGAAAGFALGVRYQMVALLPAVLVAAWRQGPRARRCAAALAGFALGYAPQALLAWRAFGSPFYQENWRNLVLKVVWHYDPWAMGDARPYTGLGDVLRAHWLDLLSAGLRDLGTELAGGLARLCCGGDSFAMVLVVAVGCWFAWRQAAGRALVAFGAVYLVLVCTASIPAERWALPLLPAIAVVLGALPAAAPGRWLRAAAQVPAAVCVALGCWQLPGRLAAFAASHPTAEVTAVAALRAQLTASDGIASSYPSIARHAAGRTVAISSRAFAGLAGTALLDRVAVLAGERRFEFLVCSRVSSGETLAALRDRAGRDDHACVVEQWSEDLAIVRCRPPLAGVRRVAVEQAPAGRARFAIEIAGEELAGAPVLAAALRIAAPGARFTLLLQRDGARFAGECAPPPAAGTWRCEPMLMLADGSLRRGAAVDLSIAGPAGAPVDAALQRR